MQVTAYKSLVICRSNHLPQCDVEAPTFTPEETLTVDSEGVAAATGKNTDGIELKFN